jgi:hypothetical protein
MRALSKVDPITTAKRRRLRTAVSVRRRNDFYLAPMTGLELFEAAPEPKQLLTYESDPAVDLSEIRIDRLRFLKQAHGAQL